MAYTKAPTEHAFIKIERDLKAGDIPRLVLLCGREDYLTDHYAHVLIDRFVEPASRAMDLVSLSGAEVTAQAVEENVEVFSLLSQRRVIFLPGLVNQRGKVPKQLEQGKKFDEFLAGLAGVPEGVLLLITAEKPITTGDYQKQSDGRRLKKLQTAVTKAGGRVYDFTSLEQGQLRGFIAKRFQNAGKECSYSVLARITRDTGYGSRYNDYDLFGLENDLRKIIAHSGNRREITEADLEGTLTVSPENNVFRMLDAISQGRKDQALVYLNTLLEDGDSEFGILMNIVRQVEMMLTARQMQDEGQPRASIIQWLKKEDHAAEFRAKTAADAASRIPSDRLKHMLLAAYAVEEHIKTGLMSPRLSLEYFISEA
ncbi:MAG: DNA polymerase III subunit delta [Firmicutes bacterium]|nr:DNA polymerase III subunit delta [Bacillota bacterium]